MFLQYSPNAMTTSSLFCIGRLVCYQSIGGDGMYVGRWAHIGKAMSMGALKYIYIFKINL